MPYAPGVQDISGQLRAQGIAQAGQAWSQAIGNIGKDLGDAFQTYKQNQFITNQAMGQIAGYTKANPDVLKYLEGAGSDDPNAPALSPEVLKSWSNVKSGKPKMQDAATVKAFLESYQAEQMNKQKMLEQTQRAALLGYQVDEAKRNADFWKTLQAAQQGSGNEQQPPPGGQPIQAQPPVQPAYGVQTASPNPAVPAMLSRFMPQQAAPAPQAAPAAPAMAGRPSGVATQQDYLAAARINPGANRAQLDKEAQRIAEDRLKSFLGEAVYTGPEGQQRASAKAEELNRSGAAPEGMMYSPEFSESAKGFYPKLREKPMSQTEQVRLATEKARGEQTAKAQIEEASSFIKDINSSAAAAIDDNARINRIRELYRKKAESGKLAAWTLDARTALAEAGLGDRIKTGDEQELRALLARSALQAARTYYKGQGSTSNEERARIDQTIDAYDKGQITNEQLMNFAEAHNRKLVAASRLDTELKKKKVPLEDRGTALQEWWLNNPVDKYMGDGVTEEYNFSPEGILVKAPKAAPAAQRQPAPAAQTAGEWQDINGYKVRVITR